MRKLSWKDHHFSRPVWRMKAIFRIISRKIRVIRFSIRSILSPIRFYIKFFDFNGKQQSLFNRVIDIWFLRIERWCSIIIWRRLWKIGKICKSRRKTSRFIRKASFFLSNMKYFKGLFIRLLLGDFQQVAECLQRNRWFWNKVSFWNKYRRILIWELGNMVMDPKQRSYFEAFQKYIQNKFFFMNKMPEMKHEFSLSRLINEVF